VQPDATAIARAALATGRLNVCSGATDKQSADIRDKIDGEVVLSAFGELEHLLSELEDLGPFRGKAVSLDLVFHSKEPDYVIVLSDGEIRTGDPALEHFVEHYASALADLNIRCLRLLGCRTACSKVGKDTIADLSKRLNVSAYGTIDVIGGSDFTDYGFKDANTYRLYPNSDGDQPLDLSQATKVTVRLQALNRERPKFAPVQTRVLPPDRMPALGDYLDNDWRSVPGLMVRPSAQLVVANDDRSCHRIELLLGNELLRVYPPGLPTGAVCRIKDQTGFAQWLSDLQLV
jgi:hypothetical protein